MDDDLAQMAREQLVEEVKRLRAGIRAHRDSTGHDLCWHHPQLWGLLPERIEPEIAVPPWPKFLRRLPQIPKIPGSPGRRRAALGCGLRRRAKALN
jgi:hypothetical protein